MRTLADGTAVRGGFMSGGMHILFLIIAILLIVAIIRRIVMMHRFRKAMKNGNMDEIALHSPGGRMMMRGYFTDDQAAGIIIRSMKKNGSSDDEIRTSMTEKYGYSALKTDAMLLISPGNQRAD